MMRKVFNISTIVKMVILGIFGWFLFGGVMFLLWVYAESQAADAITCISNNNDGVCAIRSLKRSLYITGDDIEMGGRYGLYPSYDIGDIYAFGIGGVTQDNKKALDWYRYGYDGFYIMKIVSNVTHDFSPEYLLSVAKCYAGVSCAGVLYSSVTVKPNLQQSMLWLNYASNFGVNEAQNINQECLKTKDKLLNESAIFNCIKDKMLEIKTSNE